MIRFAIFCRVSSDEQLQGQSLEVQQKTLRQCVQSLGGEVVKEYVGQESATKSNRPILDRLLADCSSGLFDACMIYDSSRLDRDPVRAKISFATFKKHGIKLYIQHSQYDLNNPESAFIASVMSEVSQFQVAIQTKKSMESKIELARKGFPLAKHPWGRQLTNSTRDEYPQWEVISECKELAEKIFRLYVEESNDFATISKELDVPITSIREILFKYSGSTWRQSIQYEGKSEVILTPVPPLLSDEQIERAAHTARSNRQFNARKYQYLLGGKIKCGVCNLTYIGNSTMVGNRFKRLYRHPNKFHSDLCVKNISCENIELAVLNSISALFSSTDNLKLAIENAIGVSRERKDLLILKIEDTRKKLKKLDQSKDRLVKSVLDGLFTNEEVSKEMTRIRKDTLELREKLEEYQRQWNTLSVDVPDDLHIRIQNYYHQLCGSEEQSILEWSFDAQEKLIQWFFGMSKRNGVFIRYNGPRENGIAFNVVGALSSSLIGLISHSGSNVVLGADTWHRQFSEDQELVDFQQVIRVVENGNYLPSVLEYTLSVFGVSKPNRKVL